MAYEQVSQKLNMNCQKRIQNFIELISNVMESYSTVLFVLDEEKKDILQIKSFYSFSKNINKKSRISQGEGLIGWVYREQKPVLANNFERSTTTLKFYKNDENIKSLLAVPLPNKKGVLCVDSKKSYRFTENKEKIFKQMAITAVDLILSEKENKENTLFKNINNFFLELEDFLLIKKINIEKTKNLLKLIVNTFNISVLVFLLKNEDILILKRKSIKDDIAYTNVSFKKFSYEGLLGWTIKNKKPLFLESISERSKRSFILYKDENFGPCSNFLGIPCINKVSNTFGSFGFIKNKKEKWEKEEIEFLKRATSRIFDFYLKK